MKRNMASSATPMSREITAVASMASPPPDRVKRRPSTVRIVLITVDTAK